MRTRDFFFSRCLVLTVFSVAATSGCKEPTDAVKSSVTGSMPNPGGDASVPGGPKGPQDQTGSGPGAGSSKAGVPGPGQDPELGCSDGEQRQCSETPEGASIVFPTPEPQGSCKRGLSTCEGDAWGPCIGAVAPKAQDSCEPGNDDNCNGKPTDHCSCAPGEVEACGSGEGACKQGTMTCQPDGTWGECVGAVGPTQELCDGNNIDEDCNGSADLADPACACLDEQFERCDLPGQGDCALGVKQCKQGVFSACEARFAGAEEVCGRQEDGKEALLGRATGDEDCDGKIDESDIRTRAPRGCENWMLDADQDGYGAIGENVATGLDGATWGCLCPGQEPTGWTRAAPDKQNTDCGDCEETGASVNPGAKWFRDRASECLIELNYPLTFDYNCDGNNELEYAEKFTCELNENLDECDIKGNWGTETPPACGESQQFFTGEQCAFVAGACLRTQKAPPPRTQHCR